MTDLSIDDVFSLGQSHVRDSTELQFHSFYSLLTYSFPWLNGRSLVSVEDEHALSDTLTYSGENLMLSFVERSQLLPHQEVLIDRNSYVTSLWASGPCKGGEVLQRQQDRRGLKAERVRRLHCTLLKESLRPQAAKLFSSVCVYDTVNECGQKKSFP